MYVVNGTLTKTRTSANTKLMHPKMKVDTHELSVKRSGMMAKISGSPSKKVTC
ncbi:hypothetical protein NBRC111894_340 [Sporolactobacillus inulinus]|uniref:Uncharacterized protein n=1 Tax=Sporolactobacillus inulinus TaxID=2078 RepID=A0A4Y1Z790_9BACL|nr:hypothetical protein NBRC111894_340 [Sporolactobacillus inulinus]